MTREQFELELATVQEDLSAKRAAFNLAGGRGVELADEIDELEFRRARLEYARTPGNTLPKVEETNEDPIMGAFFRSAEYTSDPRDSDDFVFREDLGAYWVTCNNESQWLVKQEPTGFTFIPVHP